MKKTNQQLINGCYASGGSPIVSGGGLFVSCATHNSAVNPGSNSHMNVTGNDENTAADGVTTTTSDYTPVPHSNMTMALWGAGLGLASGLAIGFFVKKGWKGYLWWGLGGTLVVSGAFAGGNALLNNYRNKKETSDNGEIKSQLSGKHGAFANVSDPVNTEYTVVETFIRDTTENGNSAQEVYYMPVGTPLRRKPGNGFKRHAGQGKPSGWYVKTNLGWAPVRALRRK